MKKASLLEGLEKRGIIRELCPRPTYWHYQVFQPEQLPASLQKEFRRLGELRF
jgi:hypothetical protein